MWQNLLLTTVFRLEQSKSSPKRKKRRPRRSTRKTKWRIGTKSCSLKNKNWSRKWNRRRRRYTIWSKIQKKPKRKLSKCLARSEQTKTPTLSWALCSLQPLKDKFRSKAGSPSKPIQSPSKRDPHAQILTTQDWANQRTFKILSRRTF